MKHGASDKTKVGNMVVKEFLKQNGVELGKFSTTEKVMCKLQGGGSIKPLVGRFQHLYHVQVKPSLHPDGTLKDYFWVSGRKIPLR